MDTFEPLIELRGEWRSAAAISVPAAAAQVAAALDRALDVLVEADQVDEDSLTMAAETVCKAVVARPDEVELLRRRLHRAIRDYATVTAIDQAPTSADSAAFESEEALAAALFASVGDSIGVDDAFQQEVAADRTGGPRRIDEEKLRRTLAKQPGKARKRVLALVQVLVPLLAVGGVSFYVYLNYYRPTAAPPAPVAAVCQVQSTGNFRNGCFKGSQANCPGEATVSPDACAWSVAVDAPGQISFTLRWDTGDTLSVQLFKGATPVGAAMSSAEGKIVYKTVAGTAGTYSLEVKNASAQANSLIHFNVSTGQ